MKAALFICTHAPDLCFFELCARSITKFVTGFRAVVVVVPARDFGLFVKFAAYQTADGISFTIRYRYEASEKGHWWMNATKCCADLYCDEAEMIAHIDADSVFTKPTIPASYCRSGQIVMMVRDYVVAGDARAWKGPVDRALGINAKYETMQRPEIAHWRCIYGWTRGQVETLHRMPFLEYAITHHVPEFPTLGAMALERLPGGYRRIDRDSPEGMAEPRFVEQGWSLYREDPPALAKELARLEAVIQ